MMLNTKTYFVTVPVCEDTDGLDAPLNQKNVVELKLTIAVAQIQSIEPMPGNKNATVFRMVCGRRLVVKKTLMMTRLILGL